MTPNPSTSRFRKKTNLLLIAIATTIIIVILVWQFYPILTNTPRSSQTINLPTMTLTLVALNGTELVLNEDDIGRLTSFQGTGGWLTSAGSIRGIGNYTGVAITTLCNLVGGINENNSLRVTADDGYSMVYTYKQVCGENFTTFDPTTGNEVPCQEKMTTILAYHKNGGNISSDEGPLRFAILGTEGLITEGHYWIKFVVKIEICPAVIDWILTLRGAIVENMTRSTFESGANPNCHYANWTDSNNNVWSGIPLWRLLGRVDDTNPHQGAAFNDTLADIGYTVKLVSSEGFYTELPSNRTTDNDNIILANQMEGAVLPDLYWPLRLVGNDLQSSEMIRNVVEIIIIFDGS